MTSFKPSTDPLRNLLHECGLKDTPGRRALIEILYAEKDPISLQYLEAVLIDTLDRTSLYRALQVLVATGLIQKIDLYSKDIYYEFVAGRKHHHHIICIDCGILEDVELCNMNALNMSARKKSKLFFRVNEHSLEFRGICRQCNLKKFLLK